MISSVSNVYRFNDSDRIFQGDIFLDINYEIGKRDLGEFTEVNIPYAIVVSQDCDLEHDYNTSIGKYGDDDKKLGSILVCFAYPYESFITGKHIEGQQRQSFESGSVSKQEKALKKFKANDTHKRYHYLPGNENLPDLVIDFKNYQTIPRDLIYDELKNRVFSLNELFRENLSHRFAFYLSRIGLPEL